MTNQKSNIEASLSKLKKASNNDRDTLNLKDKYPYLSVLTSKPKVNATITTTYNTSKCD